MQVLAGHVVAGAALTAEDLTDGMQLTALFGAPLTVSVADDGTVSVTIDGGTTAGIITADIVACEAIVHIVDTVLIAADDASDAADDVSDYAPAEAPVAADAAADGAGGDGEAEPADDADAAAAAVPSALRPPLPARGAA